MHTDNGNKSIKIGKLKDVIAIRVPGLSCAIIG